MATTPEITRTAAQPAAVVHLRVSLAALRAEVGPAVRDLLTTVAAQGVTPAGPWFTHYLASDGDTLECEIGIPTARPVASAGRVRPGELPAATVARCVHAGPRAGLGAAWTELNAWVKTQGRAPRTDYWERYLLGPEATLDQSQWRTELNRPLEGDEPAAR